MREKGRRPLDAVALGWRLHRRARVDTGARPRLADVPHRIAGLERGVELRWSAAHVPFVEARSAPDAAVGLGVAHAHLRLFQIDVMRRLAAGRLAEILGRPAVPFDRMLRIVGFARPVPAIAAALAPATRRWLAGFVDGLNAVVDQAEPPPEYRALDLRPTGWTVDDVLTVGRLAASDFSWQVWRDLAPLVGESGWPAVWERLLGELVDEPRDEFVDALDRGGSNAAAVAAGRSATGGALFTCDPHLTIMLPNAFLAAGVRCPELEATGLMVPGLPVFAVGRNRRIAWGGTSLHAASSDLVDVGGLAAARIDERRERIAVRGAGDAAVTVRETPFGPIVSDAPILGLDPRRPVALRWIGHRPNDEIAALLDIARADDWPAFQAALTGYASPAVTMLYADDRGRIGRATAAHLPRRPPTPRPDLVVRPEDSVGWRKPWRAGDLPAAVDPPDGLIAS
ncbi:MAG: penicillin acylase family protein, partial [Alphaproteobacteria bacterium]